MWEPLRAYLSTALPLPVTAVDLWSSLADDGWAWARWFGNIVEADAGDRHWLLGYSLGGRLALHAVLAHPRLWRGVIIVAAHPGVSDAADREACWRCDRTWGQRFLHEPWHQVIADWDRLSVFGGRPNPLPRDPKQFSPILISRAFEGYSKGRQTNLQPALAQLHQPPILYVTGSDDRKYSDLGRQLAQHCPVVRHQEVLGAGHRAPWENPARFHQIVADFIQDTVGPT